MKQVKECPECGRYNTKRREACDNCGCRLDGVPIIEVADELNENPDFGLIIQPQDDAKSIFPEYSKRYECAVCGTEYSIEHPDKAQRCVVCKHLVYDPFNTENSPKQAEEQQTHTPCLNNGATRIAEQCKTLRLISATGKESICLVVDGEYKSFGRNTCSIDYICTNTYISRAHFTYFLKDGKAFVVDTSANGTYINGMKLKKGEAYPLETGDRIRVYNEEFLIENGN